MDIIGEATLTTIQAPASIEATGASAGIDARSLKGKGAIIATALKTAGTNPTLAYKLQGSADADAVTSVALGTGAKGNGSCYDVIAGPDSVAEKITLTFTSATKAAVVGATSGALGEATVGERFTSANIAFDLVAGSAAFEADDTIEITTTERTYADVAGGAFTSLTTSPATQKLALDFDKAPRYLRMSYTVGGTDSPAYTVAIVAVSAVA